MKSPAWLLLFISTIAMGGSSAAFVRDREPHAAERNVQRPVIPSEFVSAFDKIANTLETRFHDATWNGIDWQSLRSQYRRRIQEIDSPTVFKTVVNEMLNRLHASHLAYYDDQDQEFYLLPAVMQQDLRGHQTETIGIMGRTAPNGEYTITGVLEGSPAEKSGLRVGDVIIRADGKPFTSAGSFRGKAGMAVSLSIRRIQGGDEKTLVITPERKNIVASFLEATRRSAHVIKVGKSRIGYVHLWTMANPAFQSLLEGIVTGDLHDTDGLILDLRDGYGGSPTGYADVFFRPDIAWERKGHDGSPHHSHTGYSKPLVALINEGTRSAKEYLTYQLKSSHRAVVLGRRTAGAFLGASTVAVEPNGLLELPVEGLKVDDKALENVGVLPDIEIAPSAAVKQDTMLERAQVILMQSAETKSTEKG